MAILRRCAACFLVCFVVAGAVAPAMGSDRGFPFDQELMLDAAPTRGAKRVPILEIEGDGAASIDLWCQSLRGEARVSAGSITIVPRSEPMPEPTRAMPCSPARQARDENLLAALSGVTSWRRRGDIIELFGTTTLRFHLMTN